MASPTQWTWIWANSRRWWRTGKLSVLQYMRSQRVGHDLATKQQVIWIYMGEGGIHMVLPLSLFAIPFCFNRHWSTSGTACTESLLCADLVIIETKMNHPQSCPPSRLAVEVELKFRVDGERDLHSSGSWEVQALWEQRLEWLPIPGNFLKGYRNLPEGRGRRKRSCQAECMICVNAQ